MGGLNGKYYIGLTLLAVVIKLTAQAQSVQGNSKLGGYVGIVHPIVTLSKDRVITNFKDTYTVGLPVGINIWKSPGVGFSVEFVPFVRADSSGSRMNNLLFHPGLLLALGKGWTLAGRAAFESGGRYGFTPVINKIVKKTKGLGYFVAVPMPVRFGNSHPPSFTAGIQVGITF
ncbi:MAG: hypothetical protein ACK4E0_09200 [Chitinophagaceae bacterium]